MDKDHGHNNRLKNRLFSLYGADKRRAVVIAAAFPLSISVAILSLLLLVNRASTRAAPGPGSAAAGKSASTGGWPGAETNYAALTFEVIPDDDPMEELARVLSQGQASAKAARAEGQAKAQTPAPEPEQSMQTPQQAQAIRPVYTPSRPFDPGALQNTTINSPRSASGVPFMIDNASPQVGYYALTFDGGSNCNAAADIFDTLASRGVTSTIFVTGEFIRRFPHVIKKAAGDGHEVGNHTNRHPRLTTYADDRTQSTRPEVTRQFVINELEGAARALADRTGLRFAPLWRAPYGEYNRRICEWALEAGYVHIGWRQGGSWGKNLDTNDWVPTEDSPGYRSPEQVYEKIVHIAKQPGGLNGGIILMHLGTERKLRSQQVHIILGKLIDSLRDLGYEPVTVSGLLQKSGVDLSAVSLNVE